MRRMMPPMLRSSTPAAYVVAWMFPCPPWLLLGGLSPLEASGPRNLRAVPESGRYLRGARAWPAIENTGSPSHVNPVNGLVSDVRAGQTARNSYSKKVILLRVSRLFGVSGSERNAVAECLLTLDRIGVHFCSRQRGGGWKWQHGFELPKPALGAQRVGGGFYGRPDREGRGGSHRKGDGSGGVGTESVDHVEALPAVVVVHRGVHGRPRVKFSQRRVGGEANLDAGGDQVGPRVHRQRAHGAQAAGVAPLLSPVGGFCLGVGDDRHAKQDQRGQGGGIQQIGAFHLVRGAAQFIGTHLRGGGFEARGQDF